MIKLALLSLALSAPGAAYQKGEKAAQSFQNGLKLESRPRLEMVTYVRPYPWRILLHFALISERDGTKVGSFRWDVWEKTSSATFAF